MDERSPAIRVLCVDDMPEVCEALRSYLAPHGFEILEGMGSADKLGDVVERLHPDLVLLDLRMPGKPPLDAVVELYKREREPRVIVLSGYLNWRTVIEAIGAGALGVISKDEDPHVLAELMGRAAHGEPVLSPRVQTLLDTAA